MYIQQIHIQNIRSIRNVTIDFGENPAGWHVILGENGSGKSTIVRAIALGLIGPRDIGALRLAFNDWLSFGANDGFIDLLIKRDQKLDGYSGKKAPLQKPFPVKVNLLKSGENGHKNIRVEAEQNVPVDPQNYIWSNKNGWFSAAFGPFRRFTGGDKDWDKVYFVEPRAAAHLSVFGEDVALTESLQWLRDLNNKRNEKRVEGHEEAEIWLQKIKAFVNHGNWLPHGTKLQDVFLDKIIFIDPNNQEVDVNQLSDGFRSILSLTFELLRQLVRSYGFDSVFKQLEKNNFNILLPGVIIVDEIDAHLHPTWQSKIGEWFTTRFPNIQFIVSTHSPLICRAAEKGTIWKLPEPGTDDLILPIIGQAKTRLLLGNLLDAYGTDAFGTDVSQSDAGRKLGDQLALLSLRAFKGTITKEEKVVFESLKAKMPSVG
jgi:energy-coupling factor transporter ATP-binding protein EcfA2